MLIDGWFLALLELVRLADGGPGSSDRALEGVERADGLVLGARDGLEAAPSNIPLARRSLEGEDTEGDLIVGRELGETRRRVERPAACARLER